MGKKNKSDATPVQSLMNAAAMAPTATIPGGRMWQNASVGCIIRITSITGTTPAGQMPAPVAAGVNTIPINGSINGQGPPFNLTGSNTLVISGSTNLPNGTAISGTIQADDNSFYLVSNTTYVNGTSWSITFNAPANNPAPGTTPSALLTVNGTDGQGNLVSSEMMEIQLGF